MYTIVTWVIEYVTVCTNGTINQAGDTYYPRGPVSICQDGLPR